MMEEQQVVIVWGDLYDGSMVAQVVICVVIIGGHV